jgi:SAM-dependent methyltransferase
MRPTEPQPQSASQPATRPTDGAQPTGGPKPTSCPLCGAPLPAPSLHGVDRLHGTPGSFAVTRCGRCGAGRTLPEIEEGQLAALYPSDYGPYDDRMSAPLRLLSRAIRRRQARRLWRGEPLCALRERPPGRGLDVGCGRGELAAMLIAHGWQMDGVEPSENACAAARQRGVRTSCGTLASVALEPHAYDAIVFRHSLEHTTHPLRDLRLAAAALAPDGLLLITVPNFGCWQARRFESSWYHLDLPRHRTHFTPSALMQALAACDLECVRLSTTTSAVGLAGSAQYRLFGRCLFPGGLSLRGASGLASLAWPLARLMDAIAGAGDELQLVARTQHSKPSHVP